MEGRRENGSNLIWEVLPTTHSSFDPLCLFQETGPAFCYVYIFIQLDKPPCKGDLIFSDFSVAGIKESWRDLGQLSAAYILESGSEGPGGRGRSALGPLGHGMEVDLPLPVLVDKEEAGLQERWLKR